MSRAHTSPSPLPVTSGATQRLDHWLWCARFYKTRSLAAEQASLGRVEVNDISAKASRAVRPGDHIGIRRPGDPLRQVVTVLGLARTRGPAPDAQALYEETEASIAQRKAAAEARRLAPEPALDQHQGRPTKRDRRDIVEQAQRWQRWSASIDDDEGQGP